MECFTVSLSPLVTMTTLLLPTHRFVVLVPPTRSGRRLAYSSAACPLPTVTCLRLAYMVDIEVVPATHHPPPSQTFWGGTWYWHLLSVMAGTLTWTQCVAFLRKLGFQQGYGLPTSRSTSLVFHPTDRATGRFIYLLICSFCLVHSFNYFWVNLRLGLRVFFSRLLLILLSTDVSKVSLTSKSFFIFLVQIIKSRSTLQKFTLRL